MGSAFGIFTSLMCLGLTTFPLAAGALQDKHEDSFVRVYIFIGSLSLLGVFFSSWLYVYDQKYLNCLLYNIAKEEENDE